jgi:hypothetical protein
MDAFRVPASATRRGIVRLSAAGGESDRMAGASGNARKSYSAALRITWQFCRMLRRLP